MGAREAGYDRSARPGGLPGRDALLVVACGNELRGDDGAAVRAAAQIAERYRAARIIVVRQLTPELVADVAMAARVGYLDAYAASDPYAPLRVERLMPNVASAAPLLGHRGDPAVLSALCARLYDYFPETWVVGIPAYDCAVGAAISRPTLRRIDEALALFSAWAPGAE